GGAESHRAAPRSAASLPRAQFYRGGNALSRGLRHARQARRRFAQARRAVQGVHGGAAVRGVERVYGDDGEVIFRATIPDERTNITFSPRWLKSSPSVKTVPRSGCLDDGLSDVTVIRALRTSPGRTGLSQRSSSMPPEPRLALSRKRPRTSRLM